MWGDVQVGSHPGGEFIKVGCHPGGELILCGESS